MDALLVETVDGEPLEREKARKLSKRDKSSVDSTAARLGKLDRLLTCRTFPVYTVLCRLCLPSMAVGCECLDVLARLPTWGCCHQAV